MLDPLEERMLLAANIIATGGSVVNAGDQPLTSISAGQQVYIQVNFSTSNLPANASYHISMMVNGLTIQSGAVTDGAGVSGNESWFFYLGNFFASPGTNQVTVTVDPDHAVAESSFTDNSKTFTFTASAQAVGNVSATVAQVRNAYGINSIPNFGTSSADGSGQTIALIDGANEPTILSDLDSFDKAMSATTTSTQTLYQQYGPASSFVTVYNQFGQNITANIATSGSNGVPAEDPTGHWEGEETLDVEWSHAMAPGAKLVIVEVNDDASVFTNLLAANGLAAGLPGVTVVSNSWGMTEFNGEPADDSSIFVTPQGHPGVTFLTASNDNGAITYGGHGPATPDNSYYPSTSPNVVSVGGSQLTLNNDGYGSETSWSFPTPTNTFTFAGGTQSGTWQSKSGGFNGNYGLASGGGSNSVTWTVPITSTNTGFGTELSATWIPSAGNATNVTYNVYDGASSTGTLLGSVVVDQTLAPAGTADGSRQFQELGVFFPTVDAGSNGTMTVVVTTSGANGNVAVDAVGAAPALASSGGPTTFEAEPSYQQSVQNTGMRTTPDVSFLSSEYSGVTTYLTPFQNPGNAGFNYGAFGTSLACPCWAGLIAIVNQGRVAAGGTSLNSPSNPQQTLQALYSLPAGDFHDITTGYNGYFAGAGYDNVTGRGTPITNLLVPALVAFGLPSNVVASQLAFGGQPLTGLAGQTLTHAGAGSPSLVVNVVDSHGNIAANDSSNVTITLVSANGATLGGTTTVQAINGVATFTNLVVDKAGTGYEIRVTDGALTSATSTAFSISPDLATSHLALVNQPTSTPVGKPLAPALVVEAADQFGNVITTDRSKIILSTSTGNFTGTNSVTLSNGVGTFSAIVFKTAGTYTLLATPASNSTLAVTTPITFDQTITKASTVIPTPALKNGTYVFGAPLSISDTLTSNVPTSMVPFNSTASSPTLFIGDAGTAAASFSTTGAAKFNVPILDAGSYICSIAYPGDAGHASASSSTFTLVINKAATTTTLAASSSSLVFGQLLTLTATVKATKAIPGFTPQGSVEFLDNGEPLHTLTLTGNSTATWPLTPSATGSHSFTAVYIASLDFNGSTSAAKKLTDAKDKSTIQIIAPAAGTPIAHNQTFSMSVHASVIAPGGAPLTGGQVIINDNGKQIATVSLDSQGDATTLPLVYNTAGKHSFTAVFSGDADILAATSSALKLTIT